MEKIKFDLFNNEEIIEDEIFAPKQLNIDDLPIQQINQNNKINNFNCSLCCLICSIYI